jgi:hypothetical protein
VATGLPRLVMITVSPAAALPRMSAKRWFASRAEIVVEDMILPKCSARHYIRRMQSNGKSSKQPTRGLQMRVAHDEMRAMADQLAAMERQIQRLQTAVRKLKGEP